MRKNLERPFGLLPRSWMAAVLAVILLQAVPLDGQAQELRLAYVNSEVILQSFQETQAAIQIFNQDVEEWNQEAEVRKREIEQLAKELEAQSLMLSEDKRRERERDYQRKLNEYEQFVQSIWGPSGLVAQRNEELLKPIITRIQTVLDEIGSEEGYDMILDAADNNILYADPAYDITQIVIQRLNEISETEGE